MLLFKKKGVGPDSSHLTIELILEIITIGNDCPNFYEGANFTDSSLLVVPSPSLNY